LGSDLTTETDRCMLQTKHALQFKLSLGAPALAFLWDHQVQGSAIVPGAAYMEAAIAAGRTLAKIAEAPCALVEAAIAAPCQLPKADGAASLLLTVELDWAEGGVSVRSSPADARKSAAGTLHLRGSMLAVSKTQLAAAPPAGEPAPSAEVERAACCDPLSTQAVYGQLNSAGLEYGARFRCVDPQSCTPGREGPWGGSSWGSPEGPLLTTCLSLPSSDAHRLLRNIHQGASGATASLSTADCTAALSGFIVHPSVLDNCLQLGATVPEGGQASGDGAFVPAGLAIFVVGQAMDAANGVSAVARRSTSSVRQLPNATYRDHALLSAAGGVHAVLDGLEAKQMPGAGRAVAAAAAKVAEERANIVYMVDWLVASSGGAQPAAAAATLELGGRSSALGVASGALGALQAVLAAGEPGIRLQTAAAAELPSAAGSAVSGGSGLWGMLRAFAQEAPAVSHGGMLLDLHAPQGGRTSLAVTDGSAASEADSYGSLLVSNMGMRASLLPAVGTKPTPAAFHLMPRPRGAFSGLAAEPVEVGSAEAGWVEVQVKAVGINFR
jgi:hypothetical protein